MKSISRRIRRLEERLGPSVETRFWRRLRERLEAGRRRVAQSREDSGEPLDGVRKEWGDLSGLTVNEILHRGRLRAASQSQEIQRPVGDG
jgi:hypothetical protein